MTDTLKPCPHDLPKLKPCAHCGGLARWDADEWDDDELGIHQVVYDIAVTHDAACVARGAWELEDVANAVAQAQGVTAAEWYATRAAIWNRRPEEDALRARLAEAEAERDAYRAELENVVRANPLRWDEDCRDAEPSQFQMWAQSRARDILSRYSPSEATP